MKTKDKPKYAGWHCPKCTMVIYMATQGMIDEHLKTHDSTKDKRKKIDFFEIKQALPELCSADLELVIMEATKLLRKEAVREALRAIKLSTDSKFIKRLRKL